MPGAGDAIHQLHVLGPALGSGLHHQHRRVTPKGRNMSVLDLFRLDDKVVIVTGALSGLGVAFAKALRRGRCPTWSSPHGASRSSTKPRIGEGGGRRLLGVRHRHHRSRPVPVAGRRGDGRVRSRRRPGQQRRHRHGGAATRETPEEFRAVDRHQPARLYWTAQACARVMKPGSSIVNISEHPRTHHRRLPQAAYSASKAAIVGLTRDLAQQWGSERASGSMRSRPALPVRDDRSVHPTTSTACRPSPGAAPDG